MSRARSSAFNPFMAETTLAKLEDLASKLESDEISLEDSMKAFEEGVKLVRSAQKTLRDAEQQVQLLLEQDDQPQPETFVTEDSE